MRSFTHQTAVILLALWMTLIIPVTVSHHHHPNGTATPTPEEIQGSGTSETVKDLDGAVLNHVSVPCILCGRILNPLLIQNSGSGGIVPVTGAISPTDPPRSSGKTDVHRLGDRSPPGPPVSS